MLPQLGVGGFDTQADETQKGFKRDIARDRQTFINNNRAEDVGQYMPEDNRPVADRIEIAASMYSFRRTDSTCPRASLVIVIDQVRPIPMKMNNMPPNAELISFSR